MLYIFRIFIEWHFSDSSRARFRSVTVSSSPSDFIFYIFVVARMDINVVRVALNSSSFRFCSRAFVGSLRLAFLHPPPRLGLLTHLRTILIERKTNDPLHSRFCGEDFIGAAETDISPPRVPFFSRKRIFRKENYIFLQYLSISIVVLSRYFILFYTLCF